MSHSIKDGRGSGNKALVDKEGRVYTRANVIPHPQHHSMTHGNLFLASATVTLQGSSETPIGIFKNIDSDVDFEFYITQFNSDADVVLGFNFDDEYTSGGAVVTPVNLNRGSGLTLSTNRAIMYEGGSSGDLVLDTSNRVHWHDVYMAANTQRDIDFQGGLILTNGKSMSITATGIAGDKISLIGMMSYHDAGEVL